MTWENKRTETCSKLRTNSDTICIIVQYMFIAVCVPLPRRVCWICELAALAVISVRVRECDWARAHLHQEDILEREWPHASAAAADVVSYSLRTRTPLSRITTTFGFGRTCACMRALRIRVEKAIIKYFRSWVEWVSEWDTTSSKCMCVCVHVRSDWMEEDNYRFDAHNTVRLANYQ